MFSAICVTLFGFIQQSVLVNLFIILMMLTDWAQLKPVPTRKKKTNQVNEKQTWAERIITLTLWYPLFCNLIDCLGDEFELGFTPISNSSPPTANQMKGGSKSEIYSPPKSKFTFICHRIKSLLHVTFCGSSVDSPMWVHGVLPMIGEFIGSPRFTSVNLTPGPPQCYAISNIICLHTIIELRFL